MPPWQHLHTHLIKHSIIKSQYILYKPCIVRDNARYTTCWYSNIYEDIPSAIYIQLGLYLHKPRSSTADSIFGICTS